ncbi:MAG: endolytic transglycosylase MltG [Bacillota bacterium]|nr:endolytic transglycosylase MltG [Bacillota bacterium]
MLGRSLHRLRHLRPGPGRGPLLILTACLALVACIGASVAWASRPVDPASRADVRVVIPPGSPVESIGQILYRAGLIRHPLAFRALVEWMGVPTRLHAGEYDFTPAMGLREIIRRLVRGEVATYPFTIPEGFTVEQIADLLARQGLADREKFLDAARRLELAPHSPPEPGRVRYPLEGYLFPDTYRVPRGTAESELISLMVQRFREIWDRELADKARAQGLSVHEVVTLASIVEKETGVPEERPLVAGVFWNRLRRGMLLQADPTVLYALRRTGGLLRRDLQVDSPYNTYVHPGLPPGPIANPGKAALQAVLEPAATDYLYFVARGDGTHQFSRTLREHLEAVRRYRTAR